jgi:hypothetical protein
MIEDANESQARMLLAALYEHVAQISRRIESAERRCPPTSIRGSALHHRQQSQLRRELYEAHHLIDGLHRRFPKTNRYKSSA